MYHEFYPQLFTELGYPCDPYDGQYRWLKEIPSQTLIEAVEKLPTTNEELIGLTLPKKLQGLTQYQWRLRQEARVKEYPSIGDQLDMMLKAGILPKELSDKLQSVKDKYPKPEGL